MLIKRYTLLLEEFVRGRKEVCRRTGKLQLFRIIKQIERDGTATMSNTDHVGMLLPESFLTEGNNPLDGNTMPEFA